MATITELLFADDTAVVSSTRETTCIYGESSDGIGEVTSDWGLTVSVLETMLIAAGASSENDSDLQPISIRVIAMEMANILQYLRAIIDGNGSIKSDVEESIARGTIGALRRLVFRDKNLH